MLNERIIIAGFGGQGVMTIGQLLTYGGMYENMHVSWLPSYGPEMRGGTANCHVVLSGEPISSPIINSATSVIIMNNPSLGKFEGDVEVGGDLFINSSLVDLKPNRTDVEAIYVNANEVASNLGFEKAANMVMVGAYLGRHPIIDISTLEAVLVETMTGSKAAFVPLNIQAIHDGVKICQSQIANI
ncbi:MAG: 2-oxoacid:acceptor oxidoreductase family protein [Eubacteriaceae bacterium]|nr:2-oxoacid:acceptor oxidoreductase family protein [Eubacteriaceae bacterium]